MADTFNDQLLDAMIRHQIGMLRFSGGVRNTIWQFLDEVEDDLADKILRKISRAGSSVPARLRALESLLKGVRKTRIGAWKNARRAWFEEMRAYAIAEPEFMRKTLTAIFPVELGIVLPPADQLRRIVSSQPFMGNTLLEWANQIQRADLGRIEQQIKIGIVQGEAPREISRRIVGTAKLRGRDGVTQITRRNAASITRTVANGIAAESRRQFAEANSHIVDRELFVATLDSRTTPICRRFDGEVFAVGEGPVLPLHFGERSLRVLHLHDEAIGNRPIRNFTEKSLLREYSKRNGLGSISRRNRLPRGHKGAFDKFARQRMRELTGRVPAKTTYPDFLKRQSADIQNDILGPTRARLFRKGNLTIDRFVEDNGRVLTLAELASRHSGAFQRAGLDPANFN